MTVEKKKEPEITDEPILLVQILLVALGIGFLVSVVLSVVLLFFDLPWTFGQIWGWLVVAPMIALGMVTLNGTPCKGGRA
jgi:hypothetical protein